MRNPYEGRIETRKKGKKGKRRNRRECSDRRVPDDRYDCSTRQKRRAEKRKSQKGNDAWGSHAWDNVLWQPRVITLVTFNCTRIRNRVRRQIHTKRPAILLSLYRWRYSNASRRLEPPRSDRYTVYRVFIHDSMRSIPRDIVFPPFVTSQPFAQAFLFQNARRWW